MIDTFVTFHILPGKTAEFERLHQQLLARISVQPGCANIRVLRSAANPLEYLRRQRRWHRVLLGRQLARSVGRRRPRW